MTIFKGLPTRCPVCDGSNLVITATDLRQTTAGTFFLDMTVWCKDCSYLMFFKKPVDRQEAFKMKREKNQWLSYRGEFAYISYLDIEAKVETGEDKLAKKIKKK